MVRSFLVFDDIYIVMVRSFLVFDDISKIANIFVIQLKCICPHTVGSELV